MLTRMFCAVAMLVALASPVSAHGPTPMKMRETVSIAAPPAAVWAVVSDFAGLASWHPMVTASPATPDGAKGMQRSLTLKGGGQLTESLDEIDDSGRSLSYRLLKEDTAAFPVSSYFFAITVGADGADGSTVSWEGRFYRGDTGNYPSEDLDDDAAREAMAAFVESGLGGLKAMLEKR